MSHFGQSGSNARSPVVEVKEITNDFMTFSLSNTDASMANALRRTMISEVPTIAIDVVIIKANSSPLADEFLAHRLGLIPLNCQHIDMDSFNFLRDCICDTGCELCTIRYKLSKKNLTEEVMEVTSADLQIVDSSGRNALVLPVNNENDHVLLCKLGKNQELVLEATASKGIGKEHSKWCPVAVATFQYIPEVTLNHAQLDQLNANEMVSFVNSCPRQVFSYLEAQRTVNIDNPEACIFCDECVRRAEDLKRPNLVSIKMKEGRFLFSVETNGSLTPDQVLMHAIRILHRKISVVEEELIHLQGGVGGGMPSNAPFGAMGYGGYPRYV